jgi:hypothetical protein
MASPLLEQVKLQAQVLVPVLKAFREEIGSERANRVAWRALAAWRSQLVRELHEPFTGSPVERWSAGVAASMPRVGDAVDFEVIRQEDDAFESDVTGCRFAQFFRELCEPDLGFAMLCAVDDTAAEEIGRGEVELNRTGTIMRGAERCDFRYALKKAGLPS